MKIHHQILGISDKKDAKSAAGTGKSLWKTRLQLMKPVTWIGCVWGVLCGSVTAGSCVQWSSLSNLALMFAAMIAAGPLLTGYSSTLNDLCDYEMDKINEPYRPLPSGIVTKQQVTTQAVVLLVSGLFLTKVLEPNDTTQATLMAMFAAALAFAYSAEPFKLKRNAFFSNYVHGFFYMPMPWWYGMIIMGGSISHKASIVVPMIYSMTGYGLAICNDFKAMEGDRKNGLTTIPLVLGVKWAQRLSAFFISATQLAVACYILTVGTEASGSYFYAKWIMLLTLPQIYLQNRFLLKGNIVMYMATANTFLIIGQLMAAKWLARETQRV